MNVSSRTPEGVPNHCTVCGHRFTLSPSIPPGDVPCPNCGSLVWCTSFKELDPAIANETKKAIREAIKRIDELSASTVPFVTMATKFITEVVNCLAAYAGAFWFVENDSFRPAVLINREMLDDGPPGFDSFRRSALERTRRECLTLQFPPVSERRHYIEPLNPSRYLMLYSPIPWRSQAHPFSIIEVIQRPTQSLGARAGYKCFLNEMVAKIGFSYNVNN